MKQNSYSAHIQAKLDELARTSEYLAEQVAKTRDAIHGARQRLSGGFQTDREFTDLRATLDQLVADLPILERKQRDAQFVQADCKAWLDQLPGDAALELAPLAKHDDDLSLDDARQRIADMQDEVRQLRAVPTPSPDIEKQIKAHVAAQPRPRVSGIAAGQQLRVDWPKDIIAVMALLLPEQMAAVLTKEVAHTCNTPMPLDERKKQISKLEGEIEVLQRQSLMLGAELCVLPPPVVLGVRVGRQTKRAA